MKALALVDAPDHVCCRYRIRAFEPALAVAGWSLDVLGLARGPLGRLRQLSRPAADYDTVILQRKLLPAWQFRQLRRQARRLVFDFDDAVLYPRLVRPSRARIGPQACGGSPRPSGRPTRSSPGNDFLADCALRAGAETGLGPGHPDLRGDRDDTSHRTVGDGDRRARPGLDRLVEHAPRAGTPAGRSGSDLAREVPGVRLRVICDRFPDLGAMPVVAVPWSEATEAAELAAGDVGITWVPDDLWSRGKCGLKVLQYQAAGLPVVTNPVGVHAEMIEPGVTGLAADDAATNGSDAVADSGERPGLAASNGAGGAGIGRGGLLGHGLGGDVRGDGRAARPPSRRPNLRLTGPARSRELTRTGQGHGHGPIGANG